MATWDTAYINDLPDSAFLHIGSGGTKDSDGKTVPRSLRFFPVKDASGAVDLPHLRNALSRIPQADLPQSVKDTCAAKAQAMLKSAGRSQEVVRAQPAGFELRFEEGQEMPTLTGVLAPYNEWAEIKSRMEGHFLERIAPGAFDKTIKENISRMRVLFQHGRDPAFGEKPLGPIASIRTEGDKVVYETPLLDTSYNRDLIPMLQAHPPVLGSSFRFEPIKWEDDPRPGRSAWNPKGLRERTLQEVRMSEFGPVTFPAYAGATAGLRSLTDFLLYNEVERGERDELEEMIALASAYLDAVDDDEKGAAMRAVVDQLSAIREGLDDEQAVDGEPTEVQPTEDEVPADEGDGVPPDSDAHEDEGAVDDTPPEPRAARPLTGARRRTPAVLGSRAPQTSELGRGPSWRL